MKKKLTLLSLIPVLLTTSCKSGVAHDIKEYILELDWKDNFTILQLTDTHLGDKDDLPMHYKFLDNTIEKLDTKPDLIVVTGDVFTFAGKNTVKGFCSWLESKKIPWTLTWGNHDEQCYFSIDWLTGYLNDLSKKSEYCKFIDIQDDDVHGNANFAINLKEGSVIKEQIIVMDSNRYYFGDYFGYDCFKEDQIKWYEKLVNKTKEDNGGTVVPSMMFYHIPLPEVDDAYEKGTKYADITSNIPAKTDNFQQKRENTCPPEHDYNFFKTIHDLGSTKQMFFGHDHINDFAHEYEGILFSYGVKSTDRVYFADDMLGGQTITIKSDHSVSIKQYFHSYEEVK